MEELKTTAMGMPDKLLAISRTSGVRACMIGTVVVLAFVLVWADRTALRRDQKPLMESPSAKELPVTEHLGMTRRWTMKKSGPPLTLAEIEAFEREIDGRLPDDYKQFMLEHNGGLVQPMLNVAWKGEQETIPFFRSLLPRSSGSGLRHSLERFHEVNPEATAGFLPIARTLNEQEVCLALRGKAGAVFHTVYKYKTVFRGDRVPVDVSLAPLAGSFTEFLESLTEVSPEPFCPIMELARRGTANDLDKFLAEGNSIDASGREGKTVVCEAVEFDNQEMIRACIDHGASLSGTIHSAVALQRTHLIKLLVEAGADINERDESGVRPLGCVIGTALPGEKGARNRELRDTLIKFGAVK